MGNVWEFVKAVTRRSRLFMWLISATVATIGWLNAAWSAAARPFIPFVIAALSMAAIYGAWLDERTAKLAAERAMSERQTRCQRCATEVPFWFMHAGRLPGYTVDELARELVRTEVANGYTSATLMADMKLRDGMPAQYGCRVCAGSAKLYPLQNESEDAFKARSVVA